MVALLQQPEPAQRRHLNLILHCGANNVQRTTVEEVSTPRPTTSWHPIPHIQLITQVEKTLRADVAHVG
jgi:hypothetical protein